MPTECPFPISRGLILDPYAGNMRWWKGTSAHVIFCDRFICLPGVIQATVTQLPFQDEMFDQVWADPPHFIRRSRFAPSCALSHFGAYPTREAVHAEWTAAGKELWRVTKPGADLIWKSITGAKTASQCVCDADLEWLRPYWQQVDYFSRRSRVKWSSAQTVYTRWVRHDAR